MPAITNGKVLVTGANGYLASWVIKSLLDAGYHVRGAVRSESKTSHLKNTFKEHADKLEFVVVPDITKEGAFDEAVKGIDGIAHTASPVTFNITEPRELIEPAVAGTRNILQSAFTHANDTVKRFVFTSSTAAVLSPDSESRIFNESDWNEGSVREVEEKGRDALGVNIYRASKVLAERAAWEFVESHKGKIGFDLVVLNPPFIFGPVLQEVDSPQSLNLSMLDWYDAVVKGTKTDEQLVSTPGTSFVDVRDIALAHALALQKEEAGGERIIISASPWNWQDLVIAAHKYYPSLSPGNTKYDPNTASFKFKYDASKSKRVLGLKYRTLDECTADIVDQFKERGWIQ